MEIVCYRMTSVVKVNYGHNFSQPKNKCSSFKSNTLFKMGATGFGLSFSVIITYIIIILHLVDSEL